MRNSLITAPASCMDNARDVIEFNVILAMVEMRVQDATLYPRWLL
jgi:hypothetical protein